jgi:hypothetical protein
LIERIQPLSASALSGGDNSAFASANRISDPGTSEESAKYNRIFGEVSGINKDAKFVYVSNQDQTGRAPQTATQE